MPASLDTFINQLESRYLSVLEHASLDDDRRVELNYRLNTLRLASAALGKQQLNQQQPDHPLQIGILGPTQAGKSTLVNLLLGNTDAGVSPLAGYTVHAQAFFTSANSPAATDPAAVSAGNSTLTQQHLQQLQPLFPGFTATTVGHLDPDNYRQFSLQPVSTDLLADRQPLVIWDSPDFDSVESRGYRSAVLRVAAAADVLILMLSKDKYADKSVWDTVQMLQPLGKPMLVCINKLSPSDAEAVINSFTTRFREHCGAEAPLPPIITLPYLRGLDGQGSQFEPAVRANLLATLDQALETQSRPQQTQGVCRLIDKHWDDWLEPISAEHHNRKLWQQAIASANDSAMERYREQYLEHPEKYDTFNRALAELLVLLEIPGLAGPLAKTRELVTWPVRRLFGLGQSLLGESDSSKDHHDQQDSSESPGSLERQMLRQSLAHVLAHCSTETLEQQDSASDQRQWWLDLNRQLRTGNATIEEQFDSVVRDYQREFEPEIEAAAQSLYRNLQDQPAVLNSLRAARVGADAAAVVLAVKSGGLAATDLLLAPAMFSLTSMLTEGALGKYLESVRDSLKQKQEATVKEQVFDAALQQRLVALADGLQTPALFGIDAASVTAGQRHLKDLCHD